MEATGKQGQASSDPFRGPKGEEHKGKCEQAKPLSSEEGPAPRGAVPYTIVHPSQVAQ